MFAGCAVQYEKIIKFSSILRPLSCLIDLRRREEGRTGREMRRIRGIGTKLDKQVEYERTELEKGDIKETSSNEIRHYEAK